MSVVEPRDKLRFGWSVERRAEEWLLGRLAEGSRVVARNFRCKTGEIDLIFEVPREVPKEESRGTELVFVEVRARTAGRSWVDGIESVSFPKQLRLRRAIAVFLASYRGRARGARLDLVAWDGRSFAHRPNVWLGGG